MAGRTRRFWIVPGQVDKDGRPVEFATLDDAKSKAGGDPFGLGIGAKTPVEVTETMTEDGEYTQTVQGPDGQPRVIDSGVDTKQTAIARERREAANQAQTPDEARLKKAQADAAEAAARKATQPDTITRPAPAYSASGEPLPGGTESVSRAQADYDLKVADDKRAAQQQLQQQAQQAEAAARDRARLAIEQDRLTADQAYRQYQQEIEKIRLEVEKRGQEITVRGQDLAAETARRGQDLSLQASREGNQVSMRGQDVSAGVSQRGQDLGYEQSLVGDTVQMANTIANHSAPLWQVMQVDATTRGKWGDQVPAMPANPPGPLFGTDPAAFVAGAAQSARQQRAPQYQLPPAEQYRLPAS